MSQKCSNCGGSKIEVIPKGRTAFAKFCSRCFQKCSQCEGSGFVFSQDSLGRMMAKDCECRSIVRKIDLFNTANVPSQYFDSTFENFDVSGDPTLAEAKHAATGAFRHYKNGTRKGLLFMGGVGVGKTRLVSTMIRAFTLKYEVPCLFQEFSSLLSEIKTGYDKGLSESNVLEKINNIAILVIDELGKGRKSDWEISILDTIISHRYNMQKTTIFTTNYTDRKSTTYSDPTSLKDKYAGNKEPEGDTLIERVFPRIYSRLKEMCVFVQINGPDYRQSKDGNYL